MRNPVPGCLCLIIPSMLTRLFLFIFLHCLSLPTASYRPIENFAINCGESGNITSFGGRIWTGDIGTIFFPSEKKKLSTTYTAGKQPRSITERVPYSTARPSRHEFTYSFPLVTEGQKFIRFHFYPSSYGDGEFNGSTAFFSVKTSTGFTLLNNFSAALAVDALAANGLGDRETIVRELCIHFKGGREELSITFAPTAGADTYAFVNGIEVVSMPDYLYYSSPQDGGYQFIDQQNSFRVETEIALENLYRLNVGGQYISAMGDTGMFRSWDMDNDYCVKLAFVPANSHRI